MKSFITGWNCTAANAADRRAARPAACATAGGADTGGRYRQDCAGGRPALAATGAGTGADRYRRQVPGQIPTGLRGRAGRHCPRCTASPRRWYCRGAWHCPGAPEFRRHGPSGRHGPGALLCHDLAHAVQRHIAAHHGLVDHEGRRAADFHASGQRVVGVDHRLAPRPSAFILPRIAAGSKPRSTGQPRQGLIGGIAAQRDQRVMHLLVGLVAVQQPHRDGELRRQQRLLAQDREFLQHEADVAVGASPVPRPPDRPCGNSRSGSP
jgi:hypothetical protein